MSKEYFDAEAQQHAADLDIVKERRHTEASLYQLAHGRGARWQFDQLKSQLEEKDARIAELEKQIELSKPIYSRRQLEAQLAEAKKKLGWYQSGEIHSCHAECQRPFCVLHRQLEKAEKVMEKTINFPMLQGESGHLLREYFAEKKKPQRAIPNG